MHSRAARAVGEDQQRLDALPVWRETPFFTAAERAALGFAEAVVHMADEHVPAAAFDEMAAHHTPDRVAALVGLVVAVSAWNAVGVSTRTWVPGSYQP
jgi:alkylhydroperoxidase family enzyme